MTRHLLLVLLALTSSCVIRRDPLQDPGNPETDAFVSPQDDAPRMDAPSREDAFVPAGEDAFTVACGGRTEPCCGGTTCEGSLVCAGGVCEPCGGTDERCCADGQCFGVTICDPTDAMCRPCGGADQLCCVDRTCADTATRSCSDRGRCELCGVAGGPCCDGGRCSAPLTCNGDDRCQDATTAERCETVGGPCCADGSCSPFGTYCSAGVCTSGCGGLGEACCLIGRCRTGSCRREGFLDYRCR